MSLSPCERATYVHHLVGGPQDGLRHPSAHCYETLDSNGHLYEIDGGPIRLNEAPNGLQVLNCTDDYMEPVFYQVKMKYSATAGK